MESQPQNPEFRNNPENFHTCSELAEFSENCFAGLSFHFHSLIP